MDRPTARLNSCATGRRPRGFPCATCATRTGKHVAMNRGTEVARGELIVTLDSDDACVPQTLGTARVPTGARSPRIAARSSRYRLPLRRPGGSTDRKLLSRAGRRRAGARRTLPLEGPWRKVGCGARRPHACLSIPGAAGADADPGERRLGIGSGRLTSRTSSTRLCDLSSGAGADRSAPRGSGPLRLGSMQQHRIVLSTSSFACVLQIGAPSCFALAAAHYALRFSRHARSVPAPGAATRVDVGRPGALVARSSGGMGGLGDR